MTKENEDKAVEITVNEYSETSSKLQETRKDKKTNLQVEEKNKSKVKITLQMIQENEKKHAGVTMQPYYYDSYTFNTNLEKVSVSHNERQKRDALQEIHWEGEFDPEKVIGCGAFGIVVKAIKKENKIPYALKLLDNESIITFLEHEREVAALTKLSHVNLVSYHGIKEYPNYFCIILEYVSGGSLVSLMKEGTLSESFTADVTSQILRALCYLHKKNCVHRDLKPANILFGADGVVKITDFGSSKFLMSNTVQGTLTSVKGTVSYMAPEVIQRNKYGKKCDVWSLGCTIFEMLAGTIPYSKQKQRKSTLQFFQWKRNCDTSVNFPEALSDACKDFLKSCLAFDPAERPSSKKLFKHQWFKEQKAFEKWENIQSVLPDDSNSKQAATELGKEVLEQTRKHPKFCHKFCRKWNRPCWGSLCIILILVAIVVLSITLTNKSPANDKDPNQLELHLNPDNYNRKNNTAAGENREKTVAFKQNSDDYSWGVSINFSRIPFTIDAVYANEQFELLGIKAGWTIIKINNITLNEENAEDLEDLLMGDNACTMTFSFSKVDFFEISRVMFSSRSFGFTTEPLRNGKKGAQIVKVENETLGRSLKAGQELISIQFNQVSDMKFSEITQLLETEVLPFVIHFQDIDQDENKDAKDNQGNTALHWAVRKNNAEKTQILISKGADIEATNNFEDTPLNNAICWKSAAAARVLIEAGAEKEKPKNTSDVSGLTALHMAAAIDNAEGVEILIKDGAEIEAKTNLGNTPLHIAAMKTPSEVARTLIEAGANIEAKTNKGETPLYFAAQNNSAEVARILIDAGANIGAKTNGGHTAQYIAYAMNNVEVFAILSEAEADNMKILKIGTKK